MIQRVIATLAVCALTGAALADNWPGWRGASGQGHSSEKDLPLTWSAKDNVRWKTPLPDSGTSTPIVWGDRIFLTQASENIKWPPGGGNGGPAAKRYRSLLCLDRQNGKVLWKKDVIHEAIDYTHPTSPFCSASPATDGQRVVVNYGTAGMHCYDLDGKELWSYDLGKIEHVWGHASSPIFHGNLVILWCGPGERQFLLAVNKKDGAKVWQHDEPGGADGISDKAAEKTEKPKKSPWIGSWSTPIIVKVKGQDQLLLSAPKIFKGFDPATGKQLWSCAGLTDLVYTSPLYDPATETAVAMSGFHGAALAVKLGGQGDITKDRLWHHAKQNPQRIGSGVIVGPYIYMIEANGTPHCFDLQTGAEIWKVEQRPGGDAWGSLVHAGDRLYITGRNGETLVLTASPKYEVLANNHLGEHTDASIVPSGGELFIRTFKHLWCIGKGQ